MEISNVNERLKELEAEVNFIKELKLDEGIIYEIDGKTISFEGYDYENKTVIVLVEWDDEEELQRFLDGEINEYSKDACFWTMKEEDYEKMMNGEEFR